MAGRTVTRAQLSEAVYQEVGLSRNESAELVESVIAEISGALARGEMVKISSFGSFAVRQKGQRMGRNPKTGQEVPISPRRVLVFRASNTLKTQINSGLGGVSSHGRERSPEGGNGRRQTGRPRKRIDTGLRALRLSSPPPTAGSAPLGGTKMAPPGAQMTQCGGAPNRITSARLIGSRRFGPLFAAQFLSAFNDNAVKNALVLM